MKSFVPIHTAWKWLNWESHLAAGTRTSLLTMVLACLQTEVSFSSHRISFKSLPKTDTDEDKQGPSQTDCGNISQHECFLYFYLSMNVLEGNLVVSTQILMHIPLHSTALLLRICAIDLTTEACKDMDKYIHQSIFFFCSSQTRNS